MTLAAEPRPLDIEPLIERIRAYHGDVDADLLRRAYRMAEEAHAGQLRDSGVPYIQHPLEVAHVLVDLSMDPATIIAGLLHDVVEDTSISLDTIRAQYGEEVAELVDGVTKLSQTELFRRALMESGGNRDEPVSIEKAHERAANMRKIFLAMARDVRVMIIKLADRLHNMKTLEGLPAEKQCRVSEETLQIFAPLAHRLGIWHIKWQLEDLAFKYTNREEYDRIAEMLARTRREREEILEEVRQELRARLDAENADAQRQGRQPIEAEIEGRVKHLYSIWNKMRQQRLSLDEVYDLIAVRVIVNTREECYNVLGMVHELWLPFPGLFSDHIARPKPNNYQSLHTKVLGPRGMPIEVQIRTWEMHRTAHFGVAAHWTYKEGSRVEKRYEDKLSWLRQQMFDWQSDSSSDQEFLRSVTEDLFTDQVFAFTPRGDVIDLPVGSTPLDFAFRIHSELGLKCTGARVNGVQRPFDYQIRNGDIVEIITRASAQPSFDWLNLVKTSHAKSRLRAWFRKQRHSENVIRGKELLEKEATRLGLDAKELMRSDLLSSVAQQMNYQHEEDLLAGIGHGYVAVTSILNKLRGHGPIRQQVVGWPDADGAGRPIADGKLRITAGGMEDLFVHRSRCCLPLPGEEVVGYVTRGRGIAIHREDCPNALAASEQEPHRIQQLEWAGTAGERFPTSLRMETLDRVGLAATVFAAFGERKINIKKANIRPRPGDTTLWDLVVDVANKDELNHVIRVIGAIPDVLAVSRPGPEGSAKPRTETRSRRSAKSEASPTG